MLNNPTGSQQERGTSNLPVDLRGKFGISIVLCCHNSAVRLQSTLQHLANQIVDDNVEWEIILVNNASTDDTVPVAEKFWSSITHVPLRILNEPKLGLMHARLSGIHAASYQTVGFVDDDNWLAPDWVNLAARIIPDRPSIGICGGYNEPFTEDAPPFWFSQFSRSYALGPQEEQGGDATDKKGVVFGAGMVLNKDAFLDILSKGYEPILVGRQGNKLTCGEDYEMCLALRLAGWKIWYNPDLKLRHFIPSDRLDWKYLRRIYRIVGFSSLGLDPYHFAYDQRGQSGSLLKDWQNFLIKSLLALAKNTGLLLRSSIETLEGDSKVLFLEREIGRAQALISMRNRYDNNLQKVARAPWVTTTRVTDE